MKAIVIDKKHITLVSHANGVTIVEASGRIIDLDFQSLGSIFELADLGNTYTIKDCDEIESLKSNNDEIESLKFNNDKLTERIEFLEEQLVNSDNRITELRNRITELRNDINGLTNEVNIRGQRISQLNDEIDTLKADSYKENAKYNELYNRNEYLEEQLDISCEAVTNLESSNEAFKSNIVDKNNIIKRQSDEIARLSKIIEEKTNSLIKLENIEDTLNATVKYKEGINTQLSCAREDIYKLNKQLESKTSALADKTYWLKYYRRVFRAVKEYLKPNEIYDLDSSGYNITNSIDSKFIISFKDRTVASNALNELRYCVSPRDVLSKYVNDIIEYNVDAIDIYFIEGTTPTVVRKLNNENFTITCNCVYSAEIINTFLNCGFPVNDIITFYEQYIVCNIN